MRKSPDTQGSVPSTAELVALRGLNRPVDSRWVEWATFMLMEGQDSPHLRILAGRVAPFNQFEMRKLVDSAFAELGLVTYSDKRDAAKAYAKELVKKLLQPDTAMGWVMRELVLLDVDFDLPELFDFYELDNARDSLQNGGYPYGWPEATLDNIDEIIREFARSWLERESRD